MSKIKRLCLDTNVYIIGIQEVNSDEAKILESIGYYSSVISYQLSVPLVVESLKRN